MAAFDKQNLWMTDLRTKETKLAIKVNGSGRFHGYKDMKNYICSVMKNH